jgi:hypothetical protein
VNSFGRDTQATDLRVWGTAGIVSGVVSNVVDRPTARTVPVPILSVESAIPLNRCPDHRI